MKSKTFTPLFACCLSLWTAVAMANPAEHADQAVQAGRRTSGNASASAGHSLAATGQLASGVIATPILASGVVAVGAGSAAVQAGSSLMGAATRPVGKPLPVTDETISVLPPNKALQVPSASKN